MMPCTAFSQTTKFKILVEAGKAMYCFDSTQASRMAKDLSLKALYEKKIDTLDLLRQNLEAEIDAREKAYLAQHSELLTEKGITNAQTTQIALLNQNILAYQRSDRKAKRGRLAYKTLTVVLACTTLYFAIK